MLSPVQWVRANQCSEDTSALWVVQLPNNGHFCETPVLCPEFCWGFYLLDLLNLTKKLQMWEGLFAITILQTEKVSLTEIKQFT